MERIAFIRIFSKNKQTKKLHTKTGRERKKNELLKHHREGRDAYFSTPLFPNNVLRLI